jgi:hypothetical protein
MATKMNQRLMDRAKEIHWQVAFRAAIDTLNNSVNSLAILGDWEGGSQTFHRPHVIRGLTQGYYDMLVSGPQDTEGKE